MSDDGFRLEHARGLDLIRCTALEGLPGVRHAFSTSRGAEGIPFDLGADGDSSATVQRRRTLWMQACGLGAGRPTLLRQVHGATLIDTREMGHVDGVEADGAMARRVDGALLAPSVRWADCVPVLLAATDGSVVAAVHAGWRGAAAGIARRAVEQLTGWGVDPTRIVAAVGPAIGLCCYEVGQEVGLAVARASGVELREITASGTPLRLDLRKAVCIQLSRAGLATTRIRVAPWCTACSTDLFFSYRRQKAAAGRQLATIGWC